MLENTNHLEQFAWPQPHQTVYVNNGQHFKENSSYKFVIHRPTFCFVIPRRMCVTSPWAPFKVCLTSARLSPPSTVEGLLKYLIVFIHFLSRGRRGREREEGGEREKQTGRGSAPRENTGQRQGGIWGRRKGSGGRKGGKGRLQHYSWDIIRATVCPFIRINTHKHRIHREKRPGILSSIKLSKDTPRFLQAGIQNNFLTDKTLNGNEGESSKKIKS